MVTRAVSVRRSTSASGELAALRNLTAMTRLSEEERALVRRLCVFQEVVPAGQPFDPDGRAASPRLILSGWACRQRILADGQRQIFGFLLPGDSVGLSLEPRPLDETSTVALTRVEYVDALMLREILALQDPRHERLRRALATSRRYEEACLLNHVVRLGRHSAQARLGHLLLELRDRLQRAGLCTGDRMHLPLTQETLADALGLSLVHVSRTLGQMRRGRLIAMQNGWVTLLDEAYLRAACDYGAEAPLLH
ncbi:Crp/Fnr family transcriptional regulator [Brevundimonas naejangsanensis]|uniref:Crp/Fnr family transcriptional regulator n=1 Tax=Brevundimonas naejangsanensis TaxID=588932 RepID=A0A494RDC5_9CAUL|nr:Crp/Fnr family transcriptional regulator [Brevundimonas naejangsanensis]